MASLLAKSRIDYSDVIVTPDVTKKAGQEIKTKFKTIIDKINVAKFSATLILFVMVLNSFFYFLFSFFSHIRDDNKVRIVNLKIVLST